MLVMIIMWNLCIAKKSKGYLNSYQVLYFLYQNSFSHRSVVLLCRAAITFFVHKRITYVIDHHLSCHKESFKSNMHSLCTVPCYFWFEYGVCWQFLYIQIFAKKRDAVGQSSVGNRQEGIPHKHSWRHELGLSIENPFKYGIGLLCVFTSMTCNI